MISCVEAGLDYYGDPSAIVCVKMGSEGLARLVSKRLPELGLVANLVEFPAVPKGAARIRMQVMANHSEKNIVDAVANPQDRQGRSRTGARGHRPAEPTRTARRRLSQPRPKQGFRAGPLFGFDCTIYSIETNPLKTGSVCFFVRCVDSVARRGRRRWAILFRRGAISSLTHARTREYATACDLALRP